MPDYRECVNVIQAQLTEILDVADEDQPLGEEVDLIGELGVASIELMEVIEQLEDTYDIAFPLNDLADVRTISDLARHVQQLTESS